jgi:urease accessory protein UreF
MLLLVGLLSISLYFFTSFTMESAVQNAARAIRTGQLQQGQAA